MDFQVLGPLNVVRNDVPLPLGTPKARRALACLIIHANEIVSIDRLVEALWGADPPTSAAHAVQNHISDLRRVIRSASGTSPIVTQPPGYRLDVSRGQVDAHRFEDLVGAARTTMRAGSADSAYAAASHALEMWRGDPLAEFTYDEFAQPDIRRLQELGAEARELRFEAEIAMGRAAEVVAPLEALVDEHPFRDQPRRLLVRALGALGRLSEANEAWQDYLLLLDSQLGVDSRHRQYASVGERTLQPSAVAGNRVRDTPFASAVVGSPRLLVEERLPELEKNRDQGSRRPRRWWYWVAGLVVLSLSAVVIAASSTMPTVGLLFAGQGDAGWGDLVYSGVEPIVARGDIGLEQRYASFADSQASLERKIGELASRADLVIVAWGFASDALAEVAPEHPDTMFVVVDAAVDLPNVASLLFANEEGAYLVGAAAALTSRSGRVGFVGGADLPVVDRYLAGFQAGARAVDADIDVSVVYLAPAAEPVRGFVDAMKAGELATSMYQGGVDVVFHAAGSAGAGILEAARVESEAQGVQLWMIGVDIDESLAAPAPLRSHILTSMVQRADVVVSRAIEEYLQGELGAGTAVLGVADGAVGYSMAGGHLDTHQEVLDRLASRLPARLPSSTRPRRDSILGSTE